MISPEQIYKGWEIIDSLKRLLGVHGEVGGSALSDLNTNRIKAYAKAGFKAGPLTTEIGAEVEAVRDAGKDDAEIDILEIVERYLPNVIFTPRKEQCYFSMNLSSFGINQINASEICS